MRARAVFNCASWLSLSALLSYTHLCTNGELQGVSVKNTAEIIQLTGDPEARNTYDHPGVVVPETKEISFSLSGSKVYNFPPNSITIMKLKID